MDTIIELLPGDLSSWCFVMFPDLAVGAPYDGVDGHGAIYIFHGSPEGIRTVVAQVIYASDIGDRLTTFGYSLSGGLDMDRNGYPGE